MTMKRPLLLDEWEAKEVEELVWGRMATASGNAERRDGESAEFAAQEREAFKRLHRLHNRIRAFIGEEQP
jgi:hypothetical protein